MKILIIRHGDPDYANDSLTEKGWREAEYLAERMAKLNVKQFYVSPLGRAKDTASLTLAKLGRTAIECEWLREFAPKIRRPDNADAPVCWDWLPQDWTAEEKYYRYDQWYDTDIMRAGQTGDEYRWVTGSLDQLLADYGYVREGHVYRAENPNHDTIAFFCHFGLGCVLLSHLLTVSPMVLWHGLCAAPTSVSALVTEERRLGIASFRMGSYGDLSHLYLKGESPAFSARFCECFRDAEDRHD